MSMNISLRAEITANLPNGKVRTFTENHDLYQTPTEVSYQIEKSGNPLGAYLTWLRGVVCEDDDEFDGYPELADELTDWIRSHEEEGWKVEWYVD